MTLKLVGITDEVTACDCCNKTGLARTLVIQNADGDINYYGTTCGAHLLGSESAKALNVARSQNHAARAALADRDAALAGMVRGLGDVKALVVVKFPGGFGKELLVDWSTRSVMVDVAGAVTTVALSDVYGWNVRPSTTGTRAIDAIQNTATRAHYLSAVLPTPAASFAA